MRVLRVSAGLDPIHGGPPASTVTSALAAATAGLTTVVAAVDEGERSAAAVARLRAAGVDVHCFPVTSRMPRVAWRWSVSPALVRWVREHAREFDVIHAHGAWTYTTLGALLAAKRARTAAVLTPHESMTHFDLAKSGSADRALKRLLRAYYLRTFDAVLYASELERDASGGSRQGAYIVPHAVDQVSIGERARSKGTLRIGYLGRFDPKKNIDVLVRAVPEAAELHVAGDGDLRQELERAAREAGTADRITWHGFVDDAQKGEFLARLDVLAMPSAFEGFGLAAAEALAAGVPVVVTPATGVAPIVARYDCGAVVAHEVEELRRALSDPALRQKGNAARTAAAREFALEPHGARIRHVYETVKR